MWLYFYGSWFKESRVLNREIKRKGEKDNKVGDDQALAGRKHELWELRSELAVGLKGTQHIFSPRNDRHEPSR
jgi:hypothetical protein